MAEHMTFEQYCVMAVQAATETAPEAARIWLAVRQAFSLEHGIRVDLRLYEEHSEEEGFAVERVIFTEAALLEGLLVSRYQLGHNSPDPLERGLQDLAETIIRAQYVEYIHGS